MNEALSGDVTPQPRPPRGPPTLHLHLPPPPLGVASPVACPSPLAGVLAKPALGKGSRDCRGGGAGLDSFSFQDVVCNVRGLLTFPNFQEPALGLDWICRPG